MDKNFNFQLRRKRLNSLSKEEILNELEKAAKHFNYYEFNWRDLSKVADVSGTSVKKYFGSWTNGLEELRKRLKGKGKDLLPRPFAPNRLISDKQLFDEMERIWREIGQRPSRGEWESCKPKYSYNTYKQRFGGWTNACLTFVENKMGKSVLNNDYKLSIEETKSSKYHPIQQEDTRNISLSARLKVLSRDNFRCVYCGKSPATDLGTKLHIDHIIPFSKGGKTEVNNLQTLCEECNYGKSDKLQI